jgi:hypothetical protein
MGRRIAWGVRVAGLAALWLAAGVVAGPSASADELPGCAIWADAPVEENGQVFGTAHRERCAQDRTVTVRIREDIPWLPDMTVAERTWLGVVNDDFTVGWNCPKDRSGKFFTEILTNAGGKASSSRRVLTCFS